MFPAVPDNIVYKSFVSNEPYIERNTTLANILLKKKKIIISSVDALLFPLCSPKDFKKNIFTKDRKIKDNY